MLSGTINKTGVLVIETTKLFSESTVSKILDLVQNASSKKAKTEQFITQFAKYYTPFVVISAALLAFLPPLLMQDALLSDWFRRSLVFPCCLLPMRACRLHSTEFLWRYQVRLLKMASWSKGGNFLEALNGVDTVVLDKTGTLTKGIFSVTSITAFKGIVKQKCYVLLH